MKNSDIVSKGFNATELGPLPEEWEVEALKNLNSEKKRSLNPAKFPDEVFEYYSIPAYQESKRPILEKGSRILSQKIILRNGAVLFGKLNPRVEKVWKVQSYKDSRKIGSTEWLPIFPDNKKVDSHYLYFAEWSKYVMTLSKAMVAGSTPSRQRVDPKSFYEIKIPLPPVPEQKKIAAVLSAVEEAKEKTEAVIKAAKELKKSLMKYLFTYGPVPTEEAENVSLKATEIGLIPEGWEVVRLGDIVKKTEQKDPRKNPKLRFKYIDVSSINRENVGIIDYKLYQGKNAPSRAKKLVKNEDVIFATVRPTLKRLALINEKFDGEICSTAFCVLRAKENILKPLYLFYRVGINVFMNELGKIQRGASYPSVKDSDVKGQKIPLPPLHIQQRIAEILSAVDKKIEAEENERKALEELFKTLLNSLMTARIRVNHLEIAV